MLVFATINTLSPSAVITRLRPSLFSKVNPRFSSSLASCCEIFPSEILSLSETLLYEPNSQNVEYVTS